MRSKKCAGVCGTFFIPDPRIKNQRYCSLKDCQRRRKTIWEREKRQIDADYRANQYDANKRWRAKNPSYWSDYRARHHHNRGCNHREKSGLSQKTRGNSANVDASTRLRSGEYLLQRVTESAKMDVYRVQLIAIHEDTMAQERTCGFP